MAALWLVILVVYGLLAGFSQVNALMWLLLLPMIVQDLHDARRRARPS